MSTNPYKSPSEEQQKWPKPVAIGCLIAALVAAAIVYLLLVFWLYSARSSAVEPAILTPRVAQPYSY